MRFPRGLAGLAGAGLLLGLVAEGCGTGSATAPTTTSTATSTTLAVPVAPGARKARVTSLLAANDAAFARFTSAFRSLGPAATNADLRAVAVPAASELARTAHEIDALRAGAPSATAGAIRTLTDRYNTVYQGLEALVNGYGSRGFNLSAWATAFAPAVSAANTAETNLRRQLGIATTG